MCSVVVTTVDVRHHCNVNSNFLGYVLMIWNPKSENRTDDSGGVHKARGYPRMDGLFQGKSQSKMDEEVIYLHRKPPDIWIIYDHL